MPRTMDCHPRASSTTRVGRVAFAQPMRAAAGSPPRNRPRHEYAAGERMPWTRPVAGEHQGQTAARGRDALIAPQEREQRGAPRPRAEEQLLQRVGRHEAVLARIGGDEHEVRRSRRVPRCANPAEIGSPLPVKAREARVPSSSSRSSRCAETAPRSSGKVMLYSARTTVTDAARSNWVSVGSLRAGESSASVGTGRGHFIDFRGSLGVHG